MDKKKLSEEEISRYSSDECLKQLISMTKEMSRDELIEFYALTEAYKAFHTDPDS